MNGFAATVDPSEVEKFDRLAADWWNSEGTSAPLHRMGPARMAYIREQVQIYLSPWERSTDASRAGEGLPASTEKPLTRPTVPVGRPLPRGEVNSLKPFAGLTIADIGCGGGLVCEPLARLGAEVTGVDASLEAVAVAKAHAAEAGLDIDYVCGTSESLTAAARFDVVLALEVVEHVVDVPAFIAALKALLKPGGLLIMSTPNRTPQSWLSVIVGAERILRWLPRGTHDWRRFLKPSELARHLRANGLAVRDISGIVYDPIQREFSLSRTDVSVNYLMTSTLDRHSRESGNPG